MRRSQLSRDTLRRSGEDTQPNANTSNSIANWPLIDSAGNFVARFYFVDNALGDDSNLGYIDAPVNTVFAAGQGTAVALKTREELSNRIPREGNNRIVVALFKSQATAYLNKAGAADFLDENYDGYVTCLLRASNDLTNSTTDKIDCGGITDNVGPNVDGSWTATGVAGLQITVDITSGNLPAETLLIGNKVEFQGNVTSGARTQSQMALKRISNSVFETPAAQTIANGDKLFFRRPGALFTTIRGFSGRSGMEGSVSVPRNVQVVGFRFSAATAGFYQMPARHVFCRFDGSFATGNGMPMQSGRNYRDENQTNRTLNCGLDCRSTFSSVGPIATLEDAAFHNTVSIFNDYNDGFIAAINALGLVSFGGVGGAAGKAATGAGMVVGQSGTNSKSRFAAGASLSGCKIGFSGIDLAGATLGFSMVANAEFNDVTFDGVEGALAAGVSVVDMSNGLQCRAQFFTNTATPGAGGFAILMAGGVNATFASLATSPQRDEKGNVAAGAITPIKKTVLKFSGTYVGAVGLLLNYLADAGTAAATNNAAAISYPMPACRVRNLRIQATVNPLAGILTCTIYKNGAATAVTTTIAAGAVTLSSDLTHEAQFAAGDVLDLVLSETGVGTAVLAASVECY